MFAWGAQKVRVQSTFVYASRSILMQTQDLLQNENALTLDAHKMCTPSNNQTKPKRAADQMNMHKIQ